MWLIVTTRQNDKMGTDKIWETTNLWTIAKCTLKSKNCETLRDQHCQCSSVGLGFIRVDICHSEKLHSLHSLNSM